MLMFTRFEGASENSVRQFEEHAALRDVPRAFYERAFPKRLDLQLGYYEHDDDKLSLILGNTYSSAECLSGGFCKGLHL